MITIGEFDFADTEIRQGFFDSNVMLGTVARWHGGNRQYRVSARVEGATVVDGVIGNITNFAVQSAFEICVGRAQRDHARWLDRQREARTFGITATTAAFPRPLSQFFIDTEGSSTEF